jgi:alkylhydroperoxidase/carboxymuconolactone decarboxylase family protein YurZ
MQDLRTILSHDDLLALRQSYDRAAMSSAAAGPFAVVYPPLEPWVRETANTFFECSVLAPPDRERCIITLLTINGIAASLAIHIYWGLMEGLTVDDVCETIGLVGVYAGIPRVAFGMTVLQRVLASLSASLKSGKTGSDFIVSVFIAELR